MNDLDLRVKTLPDAEHRVYKFMRAFLKDNCGVPPTLRQIMAGADVSSTSMVSTCLRHLHARGLLVKAKISARAYTVPEMAEAAKGLSK